MIKLKFNLSRLAAIAFLALQITAFTAILSCPLPAAAQSEKIKPMEFTPQVTIPSSKLISGATTTVGSYSATSGNMTSDLLPRYIMAIYNYGLALAGIVATIVLMFGGFNWVISGGDQAKVTQAKELIGSSITGLIILMIGWVILNTINPNLVNLKPIELQITQRTSDTVCCDRAYGQAIFRLTKNKEGQRVYASDTKKIFPGCGYVFGAEFSPTAAQCPEVPNVLYSCISSPDSLVGADTYKCVDTSDVCCACKVGLFGSIFQTMCDDNMKMGACEEFCATKGSHVTFVYPGEYKCGLSAGGMLAWCEPPNGRW